MAKFNANLLKNQLVVAWIALLVTLTHASINALLYFRGSQIETDGRQVLIYLQSGPHGSSLSTAMELVIMNGSPWYGDSLVGATAELARDPPADPVGLPPYEGIINPRFGASCPADGRCLGLKSLAVQFLDEGIKSVSPSGAQVAWVSFQVPCRNFGAPCDPLDGRDSVKALLGRRWTLSVTGRFVHEGKVSTSCAFGPITTANYDSIRKNGWTSITCAPEGS